MAERAPRPSLPGKLTGAVHHHLRRERAGDAELLRVALLPAAELRRREGVGPAIVVPIIDVFFEHDDLGAGDGLKAIQLGEEGIRRRAAQAALRGKELDQNGPCGGSLLGGTGGCERENDNLDSSHKTAQTPIFTAAGLAERFDNTSFSYRSISPNQAMPAGTPFLLAVVIPHGRPRQALQLFEQRQPLGEIHPSARLPQARRWVPAAR